MPERAGKMDLAHPRYWPTWVGIGILRAAAHLPLPWLARIGHGLGYLLYYLHAPRRHIVDVNLAKCFPELSIRERRHLVRAHFASLGQGLFDAGLAWFAPTKRNARMVRFVGREHYEQAIATGRRVILLAPHFVATEAIITLASERPMAVMYKKTKNAAFNRVLQTRRLRYGGLIIEKDEGLKRMVRALRNGAVFVYLPDQDTGQAHSVFVPFFGVPTATLAVLGRLVQVTDAIVVPCHPRQLPGGRGYELIFRPAFADADIASPESSALRINQEIEDAIRLMPEQYFWVHKRFKTRPEGESSFY